ncbi:hypothetical protein [Pseudorhodobacter sp.]|uniref:hypothetical protein n=1 Tax=Pseudorhodobacter sp. TaxID=1934400 RepID=UPI002AFF7D85|nr:hypothetical protein [Pseudorhodobacter sp.]
MTYVAAAKPVASLASLAARPFIAFYNLLILLAEMNPRMEAVNKLNALTDAQLAERGTTRGEEVRRLFANKYHF